MSKIHLLIILFLVISFTACNNAEKKDGSINISLVNGNNVTVCDLSKVSSKEELLLSEIIDEFEIIHLDDKDEAFFKAWVITVTNNYIGIRQHGNAPFKLFDRRGKFLVDIGKVGNGPGEYSIALYDEIIDEKNNRIYFSSFMGNKILVYGMEGNHIKDIQLPFEIQKPKIQLTEEGNLTVIHMPFENNEYFAFEVDYNGNIMRGIAPFDDMQVDGFDSELFSNRNTSAFEIYNTNLDTLYHVDMENLKLIPVLTSIERKDGWFCVYSELPDRYLINTFDFKTKESRMVSNRKDSQTSSEVKLVNDYLGKLEMDFNFNKRYFIQNFEPGALQEIIEKHLASTNIAGEDKEKLNTLLNTLDENHNNVLMIGKLREF